MTPHYEERLQQDLDWIQELVSIIGSAAGDALDNAVKAVMTRDRDLAASIVVGDYAINRQVRELDRLCHVFVARHLPSAGHLRYVSSVLRLGIALERIGDYARTVSRTAAQLSEVPPPVVARDIEMMSEQARHTFQAALQSFLQRDVAQAQAVISGARRLTDYFDRVFKDLVKEGEAATRPVREMFGLMAVFNRLERVIHQAKNVCEEAIFVVTGRTKGEKQFDILFVDDSNSGASQLAEHFTRKAFPQSGRYRSAGWAAAEEVAPAYVEFASSVGLDLSEAWPTSLDTLLPKLDDFQFVIALTADGRERIGAVPFHTTVLVWDLGSLNGPEEVYRRLTTLARDLMDRLRGEQAG